MRLWHGLLTRFFPKATPFVAWKKIGIGKFASCVRHGTHGWTMYVGVRHDATPEDTYERAVRVRSFGWSYAPVPASARDYVKHGTPEIGCHESNTMHR